VSDNIEYLSADDEDRVLVAQASTQIDKSGKIIEDRIRARVKGDFPIVGPADVDYIEVSPNQILSVAAAWIPFLEHDDANRALMGSNMQRQAVPLISPQTPIVGTGIEKQVAIDSRSCV
jgi:DNA-directed RNA polymerase subunit beta